jgi:hypothetical protein
MRASFLYIVVLLCKIIKFICRFFGFLHRAPSATRSDSVRRPVRLRPPSDQIASAVRLLVLMFYGENTKHL